MNFWLIASVWLGLALAAAYLSHCVRLPSAVCEIVVGALAPFLLRPLLGAEALNPATPWIVFLAGAGALLLTFLAGTELEPSSLKGMWREAAVTGAVSFCTPLIGVVAVARFVLGWSMPASSLAAVALSTACVSVVYTIMLDSQMNRTRLGQSLLAASYVNNLFSATVMCVLLATMTSRVFISLAISAAVFAVMPFASGRVLGRFRSRVSQPDVRYVLFLLFGLGGLAVWGGGEIVLPAYIMGMLLARHAGGNGALIQHLRALTFGVLTPFYFLRAGAQMWIPALAAAPLLFAVLLSAKLGSKLTAVMPTLRMFSYQRRDAAYYSLMMSSGLGLGTIAASVGLAHGIINQTQYSHIVAAVIGSAVVPTAIANAYFSPKHAGAKAVEPVPVRPRRFVAGG